MVGMAQWAVVIPADRWATERLFHHEALTVDLASAAAPAAGSAQAAPADGDDVLLFAGEDLVALGRVASAAAGVLEVAYVRRAFDAPVPAEDVKLADDVTAVEPDVYQRLAARLGGDRDRTTWLVSVALPIEATSPAEAVRQFWSHVLELGPAELPAYVWPSGDELAMQAFVLGAEANQDPEEDDD
jgi:hypothetical protein